MELERRATLRRLERFRRRVPHVTQAALVEILAAVEELGVPENASRANFRAARDDRVHRWAIVERA